MIYKLKAIIFLAILTINLYADQNNTEQPIHGTLKEHWITVFVHGTIMPYVNLFDLIKLSCPGKPKKSMLTTMVETTRPAPFFFQNQPIQGLGLKQIDLENEHRRGNGAQACAITFELLNERCYPERINRYYTFGWSGLLNGYIRNKASTKLFEELKAEVTRLYNLVKSPIHICLVSYSHGGNVCLDLGTMATKGSSPFAIDELIMYGMPVQRDSYYGLVSPLFKKIYNCYSLGDRIQTLDVISGSKPTRIFEPNKCCNITGKPLPDNLKQISIRLNRRNTPYKEGCYYPVKSTRRVLPGHIELWCFSWSLRWYRQGFPIQPFPIVAFTPYIIDKVDTLGLSNDLIFELSPNSGQTIVTSILPNGTIVEKFAKSMTSTDIAWLQKKVRAFKPANYKKRYRKQWRRFYARSRYELPCG